jgi:hypothetical protein
MKKLIVAVLLPLATAVTCAPPASAATPTPATAVRTITSSPLCIGFGSIAYCVPFT